MKLLQTFIFGERAVGEKLKQPTFRTIYPTDQPADFNDWMTQTLDQLRTKRKLSHKKRVAHSIKKA